MIRNIVVSMALLCLVASCGLQEEDQARVIEDVPFELLGTTTSTTSTTVPESTFFTVIFYWHTASDNRLQAITRAKEEPSTAADTLRELVNGPTQEELEENPTLQPRLDPSMEPRLSQVDGSTYQIQIQRPIEEALTTEQAAEFVCTAVQFAEIEAITIVNADDEPFTLSGAGAVAIAGPARAADFLDCVEEEPRVDPEPDAETTTTTE